MSKFFKIALLLAAFNVHAADNKWYKADVYALQDTRLQIHALAIKWLNKINGTTEANQFVFLMKRVEALKELEVKLSSFSTTLDIAGYTAKEDKLALRARLAAYCVNDLEFDKVNSEAVLLSNAYTIQQLKNENQQVAGDIDEYASAYVAAHKKAVSICKSIN